MDGRRHLFSPWLGDALLVVDVQKDYLPGGALGIPEGGQVVPVLNEYVRRFARRGLPVVASRSWHPPDHCSFRAAGGPWPPHCLADSAGAQFPPDLDLPPKTRILSRATDRAPDCPSAFAGTDLALRLRQAGVKRVFVGGLATDHGVRETVEDALDLGFAAVLLLDAVRAVDVRPGDGAAAIAGMARRGARQAALEDFPP